MRMKPNYGGLDRFRIVSALLVIAIHTSPLASFHEGADFFLTRVLARIAVPFFLMVTGQFVVAGFLTSSTKGLTRLRKYLWRTLLLYIFCLLLYLPIGVYAGHYEDMDVIKALRMFFFDGTFYHLWYFPACLLGVLLVCLTARVLSLKAMTVLAALLYVVGLFGDSYYGLAQKVPPLAAAYEFSFRISSYTRNGLFFAPIFLILGARIGIAERRQNRSETALEQNWQTDSRSRSFLGLLGILSFAFMTGEAFLLRHFELQRHDSMYVALLPTMLFLYCWLLGVRKRSCRYFRLMSTWIYVLHPAFIVVVRGIAKPLKLTEPLVENSLVHYLAVALLSLLAAFLLAFLQGKLARYLSVSKKHSQNSDMGASEHRLPEYDVIQEYNETDYQDLEYQEEGQDMKPLDSQYTDLDYQDSEYQDLDYQAPRYQDPEYQGSEYQEAQTQELPFIRRAQDSIIVQEKDVPHASSRSAGEAYVRPVGSRAWIEIDSDALAHNVSFLRSRLPEHCRLMPAVKAEGYGHGAVLISRELNQLGVDAFCVACISEAIELREADVEGEILILGYTAPEDFSLLSRYQLIQTVIDYPYAQLLNQAGQTIHVHIGIDTGMHRLGIRCEHMDEIRSVYGMENLRVEGLFTHLCVSDSPLPEHIAFTNSQVKAFYQVADTLKEEGYPCSGLHLLASYGILNLLQGQTSKKENARPFADGRSAYTDQRLAADYVRPGIVLYGGLSTEADTKPWHDLLMPVLSLKAKVTSIRPLYAGESCGYGAAFTAKKDMRIATISIGYADGLPRELSYGKGNALLHGCKVPILGRICMDQATIDVTDIPATQPGDTVVLVGRSGRQEITVGEVAEQCGTITNEILSRLGPRLERVLL